MALCVAEKLGPHGRRNRPGTRIGRSDAGKGPIREERDGEVVGGKAQEPWSTEYVENSLHVRAAYGIAGWERCQGSRGDGPDVACAPDRSVAGIVTDPQAAVGVQREHIGLGRNEREIGRIRSGTVRAALSNKRVDSSRGNVAPDLAATGKRIGDCEV